MIPPAVISLFVTFITLFYILQGDDESEEGGDGRIKYRNFSIYVLNDTYKNLNQRASVISEWGKTGGGQQWKTVLRETENI